MEYRTKKKKKQTYTMGLDNAISRFLGHTDVKRTRTMQRQHEKQLEPFKKWAKEQNEGRIIRMEEIYPGMISNYLGFLRDEGYRPATINNYMGSVKRFLAISAYMGECESMDLSVIKADRSKEHLPNKAFTVEECSELFKRLDERDKTGRTPIFARLQFLAGLRPSEVVRLSESAGEWIGDNCFMPTESKTEGKGIPRYIFLTDTAKELYAKARAYVVAGKGFSSFDEYGKLVSYYANQDGDNPPHYTAHQLRHTACQRMIDDGIEPAKAYTAIWHTDGLPKKVDLRYAQPVWSQILDSLKVLEKYA